MYKGNTQVELRRPQKSKFDLSHEKKLSTRMGRLTPIVCQEVLPGDKFRGSSEILLRLAPLLAPIFDSITLFVHYFFVPNRLLWAEWEPFITGGRLGTGIDPVTAPIPPYFNIRYAVPQLSTIWSQSSLADYLGIPILPIAPAAITDYTNCTLDAMPFACYYKVCQDYYIDRNFVDDTTLLPLPSGDITNATYVPPLGQIRTRDFMKEYFTAALPFTQRGTEVLMPLAGSGTVVYKDPTEVQDGTSGAVLTLNGAGTEILSGAGGPAIIVDNIEEVEITDSAVSINDLRSAVRLQEWLERNAVAGSRYTESIQAHFAVKPQDSRLQRAEFIGGGKIPVKISEVVNTAFSQNEEDQTIPAGNLAGHGVTYGNTNSFSYFAPEHGFIIGIMSIMSKPSYYQGVPRMFKRKTFLDYPWPTFARLGEQRVEKWELYASPANLTEDADGLTPLFGYQSRYADWKQSFTSNHGAFRTTLLFWTMARTFSSSPTLGSTFVAYTDSIQDRIFAASADGSDSIWCYIANNISVVRALPYFGTPTL